MDESTAKKIWITYDVPDADKTWELKERDLPEPAWHDAVIDVLKLVLKAWAARAGVSALIASNLALRWERDRWKVGVGPDVAMYIPPPPEGEDTQSVCTWEPGHAPPRVAVEVVSRGTANENYITGPDQYAASETTELWIFDPKLLGPRMHGGPWVLQVWRHDETGTFRQIYRGNGPFRSPEMDAWLVVTENGTRLRLAHDRAGTRLWLTGAEEGRQRLEEERQSAEEERQRVAALETEIGLLRAELERLRQGA